MKLSNAQIIQLKASLESIPALRKAPKALFALGKNLARLTALWKDYDSSRIKIYKECFGEVERVEEDHPRIAEFKLAHNALTATEVEFAPHTFDIADLNFEENALSPKQIADINLFLPS